MSTLQLTVRSLTGLSFQIQVPKTACGLDVKKALQVKDANLTPHLQRLVAPGRKKLSDDAKLLASGIGNGTTLSLVILPPCNIHVQAVDGRMHTVVVPSSEPEGFKILNLFKLVQTALGHSVDDFQFHLQGRPVEERRHGRELTLGDCGIRSDSTLVMTKIGLVLNVTNPKVDVCFFVDCTGSMSSSIEAVKNNIQQLRDKLVAEYTQCDLQFAFVRYTDYDQPSNTRTTYLNFTNDPSTFRSFVGTIRADGGADSPEDIMGGLTIAFSLLSWRSEACKILIHIADAPCHGTRYHSLSDDKYPSGDPAGISHESMMEQVVRLEIQYWFGYINKSVTDKMVGIFNDSLRVLSKQRLIIRQFDAIQPSEVGAAVQRSVIASVYGDAARKTAAIQDFTLDPKVPDWNAPSIVQQTATKTPPPAVNRLIDLQEGKLYLEKPSVSFAFKIAPRPFAEGSECLVYHASDLINFRRIVLKRFKQSSKEHHTLDCYMKELEVRTIAMTYAHEFNQEKLKPANTCSVEFTPLDVVQSHDGTIYMLELFLTGKIEKFNNNFGVVAKQLPYSDLLQAFSHYTWVKSGNTLLVCDLQGFKEDYRERIILTDPAVHSKRFAGQYGAMDRGQEGVKAFFHTHICSSICTGLNLPR